MSSPFDEHDALNSAAMLDAFGEDAIYSPASRADEYAAQAPDGDRVRVGVTGVFSSGPRRGDMKGQVAGAEFSGPTQFQSATAEFWLPCDEAAKLDNPKKGDLFALHTRPDRPVYEIASVDRSDMGDLAFRLTLLEGATWA